MNQPLTKSRILLGDTLKSANFLSLLATIEDTAEWCGLYPEIMYSSDRIVVTLSDDYMREIAEIEIVHTKDFCGCGRSAVTLQSPADTAWLLWARA